MDVTAQTHHQLQHLTFHCSYLLDLRQLYFHPTYPTWSAITTTATALVTTGMISLITLKVTATGSNVHARPKIMTHAGHHPVYCCFCLRSPISTQHYYRYSRSRATAV
jgi:hypothetical protein